MMVDMGLDNIVHNDREPHHARILNDRIKDWESDILRTRYQENEQQLLKKYNNIRFLDDEDIQTDKETVVSMPRKCAQYAHNWTLLSEDTLRP